MLKRDNATRWNSWHNLLETLLRPNLRHAIEVYVDENPQLEEDRLERREWRLLEKVYKILSAFKIATKATEGHQVTLTHLLPSIDFLLNTYSEALKDNADNRVLSSMIRMGWEKLDKYFSATDRAPVYLAAVVLNPKLKWQYFEVKWDRNWVQSGKQRLKGYWLQYLANKEEEDRLNRVVGQPEERDRRDYGHSSPTPDPPAEEENPFWAWMDLRATGEPVLSDDYERYCSHAEPEPSIQNPLLYVLSL